MNNIIQELEQKVQELMKTQEWSQAYKICLEILRADPGNKKFFEYKLKIEKEVKNSNHKAIVHDLERIEPLYNEQKYEEYLSELRKLQAYSKDFPEISEKIIKGQKALEKYLQKSQGEYLNELLRQINQLRKDKKYQEALDICEKIKNLKGIEYNTEKLSKDIKHELSENEIQEHQSLLNTTKYEDIILFLIQSLNKDPSNSNLKRLLAQKKHEYLLFKIDTKKDYIYKTLEEIKTLYLMKKYDKMIELSENILQINPNDKSALSYKNKAKKKLQKRIDTEIKQQIINNYNNFKSLDKSEIVKL